MESISIDSLGSGDVKGNCVELSSLVFERPPLKPNLEAVAQRCFVKKKFLKISQNSPENTYAKNSFYSWHRFFPVNFATVLRTPFL